MREVLFKNLISKNSRKKDIFLTEVFEKNGVMAKTERRCFYFIKDIVQLKETKDVQGWISAKNTEETTNKRHFFIFKRHNDSLGEDRLICKAFGTFYVVVQNIIYTIAFLHSFKVQFTKPSLTN